MAISHVKSNTIADFTGTVTVFNSVGATQTANATDLVRPSDWNSVHNQYYTLAGNTNNASTVSGTNVVFQGAGAVTLTGTNQTIVFNAPVQSVQTQSNIQALSAGTQSVGTGTVVFADSNGVGFGLNGQTLTASYTRPVVSNAIQPVGSATGSGTNTSRFAADDHVHEGVFSVGLSTGGNTIGDTRVGAGRFVLQGGNNVTLSQITAVGGLNTIVFSGGAPGAAVENNNHNLLGANTAGNTTASGSTIGLSGINMTLSGTNGSVINMSVPATSSLSATGQVSISTNGSTISIGVPSQAFSADASSTFQTLTLQNSNGVSFSNNAGAVRITHDLQYTSATSAITSNALHSSASRVINIVAATNNTGGGTASQSGNVSFSAANGLTFYTSAGGAVVGSHNGLTTARASNDAIGLNSAFTAGPLAMTINSSGLSLNAGNAAGTSSGFTGANISASITHNTAGLALSMSVAAPGAAAENNNINLLGANTAGNTTATGSTLGFSGVNMTLSGTNNSQIVFSANAPFSAGLSNIGDAVGDTGVVTGRLVLYPFGAAYMVQSTAPGGLASLGLGAFAANVWNVGNTSGDTGPYAGLVILSGGNNITLSQLTYTATTGGITNTNAIVGISGPTISGTGQVSVSTNGGTVSIGVPNQVTMSGYLEAMLDREMLAAQIGQNQVFVQPLLLNAPVQFAEICEMVNFSNASNSSNSATLTLQVGFYTRNASTLSLVTSASSSYAVTASGTAGSYSIYGGQREYPMPLTTTLSAGNWWIAFQSRTTTGGGAGMSWSNFVASNINSAYSGRFSSANNATNQFAMGLGSYNTTTTALPNSIGLSQINGSAAVNLRQVVFKLVSGDLN